MPNLPRPTQAQLANSIFDDVTALTGIDAELDASAIGALVLTFSRYLDGLWGQLESLDRESSITEATGAYLDRWGINLGLPRQTARKASSAGRANPLRVTNTGNSTIQFPSGTRIWSTDNPQLAFYNTSGASIAAGTFVDIPVRAASVGEAYNAPIGALNSTNFQGGSVTVKNVLPLTGGSSGESDDSYRERLIQAYRSRNVFNAGVLAALIRGVPGVKDVIVIEQDRGPGTVNVYVLPWSISQTSAVVEQVGTVVEDQRGVGTDIEIKGPTYRYLDIVVQMRFKPGTDSNREAARESVRRQIRAIVDGLPIENGSGAGNLSLSLLRGVAATGDPNVLGITMTFSLDSVPLARDGVVKVELGDKLVLRALDIS
jgi:uncharacterized phage protein gp47/JayE